MLLSLLLLLFFSAVNQAPTRFRGLELVFFQIFLTITFFTKVLRLIMKMLSKLPAAWLRKKGSSVVFPQEQLYSQLLRWQSSLVAVNVYLPFYQVTESAT